MHLLIRVRLLFLLCFRAFVKSLVPLSAVVHLCSLAGYQKGLLWLVHARQVDTHARGSLRLHATRHGPVRLHLERELLCLRGAAAMGRVHCCKSSVTVWGLCRDGSAMSELLSPACHALG